MLLKLYFFYCRFSRNGLPLQVGTYMIFVMVRPSSNILCSVPKMMALQIVIYYNEVKTANPLGSYRGKHKLGMHAICA